VQSGKTRDAPRTISEGLSAPQISAGRRTCGYKNTNIIERHAWAKWSRCTDSRWQFMQLCCNLCYHWRDRILSPSCFRDSTAQRSQHNSVRAFGRVYSVMPFENGLLCPSIATVPLDGGWICKKLGCVCVVVPVEAPRDAVALLIKPYCKFLGKAMGVPTHACPCSLLSRFQQLISFICSSRPVALQRHSQS